MKSRQPLIAIDAVVLDTETTGLDPARARIVQIGALRLRRGALAPQDAFDRLVNPGEPIPPANSRIHGITDEMVAETPGFAALWPDLAGWLGDATIIGHNIGYDLAVLTRECRLAGRDAPANALLDTRLLGEIAFPRLAGYTLDALASHLGIAAENRHNALADAKITARVFLALLPHLKSHNIRTLGEAEAACRRKTELIEQLNRAGWAEPVRPVASPDAVLARIDAYPFRHRVADVAAMPPLILSPQATLAEAMRAMAEKRISSVFVADAGETAPAFIGILTERDVIRLVADAGAQALTNTIGPHATRPLLTVPAEAFIYRAIGRMESRNIRHLGVTDEAGAVIGALSARDLLRLRASDALALGDAVDEAHTLADLAAAWARIAEVAKRLLAETVSAVEIAAVISREITALTRRAAMEAEKDMLTEGHGPPPCPYAVLVLGSGGRGESLLIPDQDNATLYAGAEPGLDPDRAARWFIAHGERMARILDLVGIPFCKGKVMASNPAWNGDIEAWENRIRGWTESTTPDDLLQVDIFFDCRHAHGDFHLANRIISHARAMAADARPMVKLLADQIRAWAPPIGMFGRLKLDEGRIDLKKGGLLPIVSTARCLALSHGIAERSTAGRIAALRAMRIGADSDLELFGRAHAVFSTFILRQQLADIEAGIPPSTRVDPSILSRAENALLKDLLGAVGNASTVTHDLLFTKTPGAG